MTKVIFVADGKEFNTFAMALEVSCHVEIKYMEFWPNPAEMEESEKIRAAYRKKLELLNTPEKCAERLKSFCIGI